MSEITITPLGTISPYTKGNMNCPGILINYNNKKILLDCGSGITRLLKFPDTLEDLNVIITHYHRDHFGDIGSICYASYVYHNLGLLNNKINIFLPKNDYDFNKKSIVSSKESYARYFDITDSYSFFIDDLKITFHDNKSHTIEAFMVKLQNKDFKIIYTSDIGTSNLTDLISFCKDADLIICESSLLRRYNSNSSTHMTAYDAGLLANNSNAKKLLLIHFWPEEDKKIYLEESKEVFNDVEVAEENKTLILKK
ncbi:MAG TPA: MBL fold metallo-hydrolase [Bacilli bacterium]|jgi:ribonuclease BN (tRNA processing enzyme)|nr:MBL fold metallo-hydrolase [Bacilli bacterium]